MWFFKNRLQLTLCVLWECVCDKCVLMRVRCVCVWVCLCALALYAIKLICVFVVKALFRLRNYGQANESGDLFASRGKLIAQKESVSFAFSSRGEELQALA